MNDYAQRFCVFCAVGNCVRCVARWSDRWCECACFIWLTLKGDDG